MTHMTDALFAYAIDICITQVDMEWEWGNFCRRSRERGFLNCFFIEINKSPKTTLS